MLDALAREIGLQKEFFQDTAPLQTIYFGGGTPSLLTGDEIKKLLEKIIANFGVAAGAEITLEANPDDLSGDKLKAFHEAGVNRLSIGVQSFDDADLKWMNRVHSASEAAASVKRAQDAGFGNITIDLIYGTPLLDDEQWKKNLVTASDLRVQHLSCYALTVEPRTALAHSIAAKKIAGVDDAKQARHFELLMDFAEHNGIEQYEISNFAIDGHYSRHNSAYWQGEKYLGIGPSAHSFNGESRQWNIRNNHEYIRAIGGGKIPFDRETLTLQNRFNEYVMTTLRTMQGSNLDTLREKFGNENAEKFFGQALEQVDGGFMIQKNRNFILTRKGKLFADRIAAEFFMV